jgi:hypothetical protein
MTNPDELERAVERLTAVSNVNGSCPGWGVVRQEDLRLILSANREMRESLDEMLVIAALYLSSGDKTARRLKDAEFGPAMARARSALTTQRRDGE